MTEDISFCPIDCKRTKCRRNKSNIKNHDIPHSYFVNRPPECPYAKKKNKNKLEKGIDKRGKICET